MARHDPIPADTRLDALLADLVADAKAGQERDAAAGPSACLPFDVSRPGSSDLIAIVEALREPAAGEANIQAQTRAIRAAVREILVRELLSEAIEALTRACREPKPVNHSKHI